MVDAAGKPITSPPLVDAKGGLVDGSGAAVIDPVTGAQATIPAYSPPTVNVYVYTGSDGTTKVVDAAGKPITSPPLVDAKGGLVDGSGVAVIDPATGAQATIPAYSPPTTGIYVHDYPMLHVVDAAGKPIPSPPNVGVMAGKGPLLFDSDGNPLLDSNGDVIPVPRYMPDTWGEYAQVVTDPTTGSTTVTLVDAAGNPLPSQPKTYLAKEGDSWVVNIKDPTKLDPAHMNDDMLTDGSGNPVTVPIWDPTSVPRLLVYVVGRRHSASGGRNRKAGRQSAQREHPPFHGPADRPRCRWSTHSGRERISIDASVVFAAYSGDLCACGYRSGYGGGECADGGCGGESGAEPAGVRGAEGFMGRASRPR